MTTFLKYLTRSAALLGLLQISLSAQASNFIGDVCFQLDIPGEGAEYISLGISEVGGGHFMAQGYTFSSPEDPATERTMLSGNIELFGSTISMALTGSFADLTEIVAITAHAHLSATTLIGPVAIIGTYYSTDGEETGIEAAAGTLTPAECPTD